MTWRYAPVAIHLELHSDQHAVSGAFLLNTFTGQHYVLAITDISYPDRYTYRFVSPWCVGPSTISWLPLTLCDSKGFNEHTQNTTPKALVDFIEGLQREDRFQFKPTESTRLSVLHLRLPANIESALSLSFFDSKNLHPLIFKRSKDVKIPSKVVVQCCPFSLTNVAIFINHKIYGSTVLNLGGAGFLSDIKYLDDVIGGMAFLDAQEKESIGLICGSLTKLNGDGELLLIVSWDSIFDLLNYPDLRFPDALSSLPTSASLIRVNETFEPAKSVVRISVHSNDGRFWGSGVCLSKNLIVTNKHVVRSTDSLKDILIRVPFQPNLTLTLKDVTFHETPLDGFDLCFIRLKTPCEKLVPAKLCPLFTEQMGSLRVGQAVKSVGHGLFFSKDYLHPLAAEGRINNVIEIDLEVSGRRSKAMVIASAGCWNGSSGGGLFNKKNELIGIMTSNGRLSTGEVMPNFTLAIPVGIVEKSVFLLENNLPSVDLKQKVQDLWSLKGTHEYVVEGVAPPAHKL